MTLIETKGSVVFTRGPFEVELAMRPITILSPSFALDKVNLLLGKVLFNLLKEKQNKKYSDIIKTKKNEK